MMGDYLAHLDERVVGLLLLCPIDECDGRSCTSMIADYSSCIRTYVALPRLRGCSLPLGSPLVRMKSGFELCLQP
jgi:hypothetical protein